MRFRSFSGNTYTNTMITKKASATPTPMRTMASPYQGATAAPSAQPAVEARK